MSIGGGASTESVDFSETGEETRTSVTTGSSQLKLEQEGIDRIIENILSGPEGLAAIFQGEQTAGIFGSTVSAQAAGNLVANIVGEIAKITGETVTSETTDDILSFTKKKKGRTTGFETEAEFKLF